MENQRQKKLNFDGKDTAGLCLGSSSIKWWPNLVTLMVYLRDGVTDKGVPRVPSKCLMKSEDTPPWWAGLIAGGVTHALKTPA